MIASVNINSKSFGGKELYNDLQLTFMADKKVGLIGRNGTGKTTLLNILTGTDTDYDGEVVFSSGAIVIASKQEHHGLDDTKVLDYITRDLPEYSRLKHILDTYPETMGSDHTMIQRYSDALERFSQLGYYSIEDDLSQLFEAYQLEPILMHGPMKQLSGGQKRMVELIKVQRANADLALIDEPTNHMDYVAKEAFTSWMQSTNEAALIITHDRDVLRYVDRIIEIRDGKADIFRGNYDAYLKTNTQNISSELNEYGNVQRRIGNLKASAIRFRRLKERARDPGTISQFKMREQKALKELESLQEKDRPSFWIDQESTANLSTKITDAYEQHKARNIRIRTKQKTVQSSVTLVAVDGLSLGYDSPLFSDISFDMSEGDRLHVHGRNGAGKTTLVKSIIATGESKQMPAKAYKGTIEVEDFTSIGVYEQELSGERLDKTLEDAIRDIYYNKDLPHTEQLTRQIMNDYLFTYETDARLPVSQLSGGQKARLQLIDMLAGDPNILILDEPTNHLDLPSIEELEFALASYHGAIIYISHDSYFCDKIGGTKIFIDK